MLMTELHIHKRVLIKSDPDRVYTALTSSDEIVNYFPLKKVTSEWVVGADLIMHGDVDGVPFTDHGKIEVLNPAEQFRYRYWSDNHGTENKPENWITIDYRLSAHPDGTELALQQRNLPSADMRGMMEPVWDVLLGALRDYVEQMP